MAPSLWGSPLPPTQCCPDPCLALWPLPTDPRHPCPGAESLSPLPGGGHRQMVPARRLPQEAGSQNPSSPLALPRRAPSPWAQLRCAAWPPLRLTWQDPQGVRFPAPGWTCLEPGSSARTETQGLSRRARAPNPASATRVHKRRLLPLLLFCPPGTLQVRSRFQPGCATTHCVTSSEPLDFSVLPSARWGQPQPFFPRLPWRLGSFTWAQRTALVRAQRPAYVTRHGTCFVAPSSWTELAGPLISICWSRSTACFQSFFNPIRVYEWPLPLSVCGTGSGRL